MASYTRNHFETSINRCKHLCSRECLDHTIDSIILYSTWTRFGFHGIPKALPTLRGSKRGTAICGSYFRKHVTRTMYRGNCTDDTFASHSLLDPMCWFGQGSNLVPHIWQSSAEPTALTVCLPVCLVIYLSGGWSVCLSACLSVYLAFYLFILWNSNIVKSHTFQASHLWTVPNFTYFLGIEQFWSVPLGCCCSPIWMMEWQLSHFYFLLKEPRSDMENWCIIPLLYHF